jgi:hypothetical protein
MQLRKRAKVGLLCQGLLIASVSTAGDMSGVIKEVHLGPVYGTTVFLRLEGAVTTPQPGCKVDSSYQFAFDSNTATGRALLAVALAAQVSAQPVKVNGYNQCTHFNTVEDLRWLSIQN